MKTVKVWTSMGNSKDVQSNAATWGELEKDLKLAGINTSNMKAMDGDSFVTYEMPETQLAVSEAPVLFLMPIKTKSGGASRDIVKGLMIEHPELAKSFFNEGQNYTRKTEGDLAGLVVKWNKKYKNGVPAPKATKAATKPSKAAIVALKKVATKAPAKKAVAVKKASPTKAIVPKKKEQKPETMEQHIENTKTNIQRMEKLVTPKKEFPTQREMDETAKKISRKVWGLKEVY